MRKKYSAENSGEKNFPLKILEKKNFEKKFKKNFSAENSGEKKF